MTAFIIYLLKAIVCSGILYSYYRLVYYNRPEHKWNRFYLIAAVLASIVLPVIKISIPVITDEQPSSVIQLLNVVSTDKTEMNETATGLTNSSYTHSIIILFYVTASCVLLFHLTKSLLRIYKLYNTFPKQ